MKYRSCIFLGLELVWISLAAEYTEFGCHEYEWHNVWSTDCYGTGDFITLPNYITKKTKELKIYAYHKSVMAIKSLDTFNRFIYLKSLSIHSGKGLYIDEALLQKESIENLSKKLFHIPTLVSLKIEYEEFNEANRSWVLPQHLRAFSLHHSIFEFDIRSCSNLETLIFDDNKLSKMPSLRNPPPPLKTLKFSLENSLDEFTVNDIAGFCQLKRLQFEYYADYNHRSVCECRRLQKWVDHLVSWSGDVNKEFVSDVHLHCPHDYSPDCSNYTLDEAINQRNKCIWNHSGIFQNVVTRKILAVVFAIVVLTVIVACVVLYVGRHSEPAVKDAS